MYNCMLGISSTENPAEFFNTISAASAEGFCLSHVTEDDVILVVPHFRSQGKGEEDFPRIVVATVLIVSLWSIPICVFSIINICLLWNKSRDSVLGPHLYSLYINDLKEHLSTDDLQIYAHIPTRQIPLGNQLFVRVRSNSNSVVLV